MHFIDNFSETHLLFGADIDFMLCQDAQHINAPDSIFITMHLPLFKHCYLDYQFQVFLGLLTTPLNKILPSIQKVNTANNLYDLFCNIIVTFQFNTYYATVIQHSFEILFDDFVITQGNMCLKNYIIDEQLFNRIVDIVLMSTEHKHINNSAHIDPQLEELERKIANIKNKNKKNQKADTNFTTSYMILSYEFGYTQEQILNMTMYAISLILKYTGKSINYKVSLIGTGNGLTKKIHFITEKENKLNE